MVTTAPAMAAPLASFTVPTMEPVTSYAAAIPAMLNVNANAAKIELNVFLFIFFHPLSKFLIKLMITIRILYVNGDLFKFSLSQETQQICEFG